MKEILLKEILLTIYFWSIAIISTIITSIICFIIYPFVTEKDFNRIFENVISTLILYAMTIPGFWTFEIIDLREDKKYDKKYIFVPNHSSFIDTLLTARIPVSKKFIMKSMYSKIPFFGWLCLAAGHIPVNNSNKSSIIDLSIQGMKDGSSFLIYSEGTRSYNSKKILPFKTGAFRLAKVSGIPIVPVAIKGAGDVMPVGGMCKTGNLQLIIGNPIIINNIEIGIQQTRKFIKRYF